MTEESERLMALFRGHRSAYPPFWEPWFRMDRMLELAYDGSYLDMAEDLGHAAVPLGGVDTGTSFINRREIFDTGVWYGGGSLREPAQLRERAMPDLDRQREALQAKRDACARAGRACWITLPWCFHRIATSMGLEHFACACYDRPDFVHEAMAWVERRNLAALEAVVAPLRPDFVLLDGDCAYKTGTMVAPAMMRDFCFEPTRRTVEAVGGLGIPCVFHSDGKLDDVIPMLLDLGIAAVHGCEKNANDLAHLVETFGDRIVLCGNMDVVFLAVATPHEVEVETWRMLETGAARGRFVAGCNTSPLDYIPIENYVTMAETVRMYGRGP